MHYRLKGSISVILMSRRHDAPYQDRIEEGGKVLIYEGHDMPFKKGTPDPKTVDQPRRNPGGSLTRNGLFEKGFMESTKAGSAPEIVAVYEKIHSGIWAFNGLFKLTNVSQETVGLRKIFKFRLDITHESDAVEFGSKRELEHNRAIPSHVKLEVWKRDQGRCVICQAEDNLHFDHDLPYSRGGTSLTAKNIRVLCARHNLAKRDRIE